MIYCSNSGFIPFPEDIFFFFFLFDCLVTCLDKICNVLLSHNVQLLIFAYLKKILFYVFKPDFTVVGRPHDYIDQRSVRGYSEVVLKCFQSLRLSVFTKAFVGWEMYSEFSPFQAFPDFYCVLDSYIYFAQVQAPHSAKCG